MKELIGHASNIALRPSVKDSAVLVADVEIILIVSEAAYEPDVGGFRRAQRLSDVRVSAPPKSLRSLAARLIELADEADAMVKTVNEVQ